MALPIQFILVRPHHPANIGAAARAMKAMGFDQLVLVAPTGDYRSDQALSMAKHAHDILESARVVDSFSAAISSIDFVVGTSNNSRHVVKQITEVSELPRILEDRAAMVASVGICFGQESTGLTNEEINQCDLIATIPTMNENPPLNLSQAVMLCAYELSNLELRLKEGERYKHQMSHDPFEYEELKKLCAQTLELIDIPSGGRLHELLISRIATLERGDLHLAFKLCDQLRKATAKLKLTET